MKICFKCNVEKPLTEYYKHKAMSDGYLGKCKVCTKSDTKKRTDVLLKNPQWHEKEKQRHREKYYRLQYKDKHKPDPEDKKKAMDRYNKKFPEKQKCKSLMGKLKPKTKGNHLHHWSYNTEHAKDVIELTISEHNKVHRFLKYDQSEFMYRCKNNKLLDSRQKHLAYIGFIILYF